MSTLMCWLNLKKKHKFINEKKTVKKYEFFKEFWSGWEDADVTRDADGSIWKGSDKDNLRLLFQDIFEYL